MQVYKAPTDEMRFLLESLGYATVQALPGFEDYDLETCMAILEQAGRFCTEEMLPLNGVGDREGLKWDPETGAVTTPTGFKALYDKYVESGLGALTQPVEYGGAGAPHTLGFAMGELPTATNKSFSMAPGLGHGLTSALHAYGTDEQKATWLPKLISGEWTGTMCLTEPQCGTDLGLIRSKATPNDDGSYNLTGTKIWITFGEHDLTENIIHLVLARLPDAPPGIKGISAFVVPKLDLDGSPNGVTCGGLEHKMGINASPTCVINLEDSKGWLVGDPHRGMRSMFVMMNSARLTVGLEGMALSDIAYQTALAFAKDRRQMRSLNPERRDPNHTADCILVHPDVRRMLLNIKSTTEGMRALGYWVGMKIDISHHHPDEAEREAADDLVALLTPVVKSYFTERGFQNVSDAMQVTGGAGYTTDWPIEQYMRDVRIALIYEGTNHIQALDLVGRKLPKAGGRLMRRFADEVGAEMKVWAGDERMAEFTAPLAAASDLLTSLTMTLAQKGMADPEEAGAVASNYLNVFALTTLAFIWCKQVHAALDRTDRLGRAKVKTARFFMHHVLPEIHGLAAIIKAGKATMMDFDEDEL